MQNHDVRVAVELPLIRCRRFKKDVEHLLGDVDVLPVERVVEALGDFKERLFAVDDVPMHVEPDFVHQRDEPVENLSHAPAGERRVDLLYPASLEVSGQAANIVDFTRADDGRVGVEIHLAHIDTLASTNSAIFSRRPSSP